MKIKIKSGKNNLSAFIHISKLENSNKLAIILPGFLDSKDYPHLVELGKDLSKQGFTTIRFDPTGVWESQGSIGQYTTTQYLKDIEAVISFITIRNKNTFDKTIILGHSLGGMMAIIYATQNKNIDAVVAIMPPPSQTSPKGFQATLKEWQKNKIKISFRDIPGKPGRKRKYQVPYSYIIDSQKYEASEAIVKLKKPILILAGERDDKISPGEVKKIYLKANQPKKYILLKNTPHYYRLNKSKTKLVNKVIVEFLKKFEEIEL